MRLPFRNGSVLSNVYTLLKEEKMDETKKLRPGYRSTEWYLSVAAILLGVLLTSGAFGETEPVYKVLALALAALTALGYTAGRSFVKATKEKADALVEANRLNGSSGG